MPKKGNYSIESSPDKAIGADSSRAITLRAIVWAVSILPFLEPWSTSLLIDRGYYPELVATLSSVALAARAVVASYGLLRQIGPNSRNEKWLASLVAFSLATCMSEAFQLDANSLLSVIAQAYQMIGMAAFLLYCYKVNTTELKYALLLCMSLVACAALGTIYLTSNGLTNDSEPAARIYSFGGKNHFFVTMLPLVIISILFKGLRRSWLPCCLSLLLSFVAHYIDSSSSMACYIALAILLIPLREGYLFSKIDLRVSVAVLVLVFVGTVLTSVVTDAFSFVFQILGRESTFSSRDSIWNVALGMFIKSPLAGMGSGVTYTVGFLSGDLNTSNAHCFYLGLASQFGLISIIPFLALLVVTIQSVAKNHKVSLEGSGVLAAMFALLLHSMFDDLPLYYMVMITFLVCYAKGFSLSDSIK